MIIDGTGIVIPKAFSFVLSAPPCSSGLKGFNPEEHNIASMVAEIGLNYNNWVIMIAVADLPQPSLYNPQRQHGPGQRVLLADDQCIVDQ